MEEKLYRTMRGTGATNIVIGVLTLVVGVTSGILIYQRCKTAVAQISYPVLKAVGISSGGAHLSYFRADVEERSASGGCIWGGRKIIFLPIKNTPSVRLCQRFWEL